MFSDENNYKDLPKDYQMEIIHFLETFIKYNKYHKVSNYNHY